MFSLLINDSKVELFIDQAYVLICSDFGFAQYMSPWDEHSVLRGSPLYMAPEMVCRRQYDSRADLWSVGVILYGELLLICAVISADQHFVATHLYHRACRSAVWTGTICIKVIC